MPNWTYNRLRVSGDAKHLKDFAVAIGGGKEAIDFAKLATLIARTWDKRDEGSSRLEKIKGGGLVYFFDTAWGTRPKLILDLSKVFASLHFELFYIEEGPQFAGALVCKSGQQLGEAYLGEEELEDFLVSTTDWEDDDEESVEQELDRQALEEYLLQRAHAGGVVDWEGRKRKLEQLRSDAQTAALTRLRSRLQDLTSIPKLYPPKKKSTDELLCAAIRGFESNYTYRKHAEIDLVPPAYWSEWVALQFCMTHEANFKKLPKDLKTQSFWDKFIKCKTTLSAYYNPKLKEVPAKFRSDSVIRYALQHDSQALQTLKLQQRTPERCKWAVQHYGLQLKHVPLVLRTPQLCRLAVLDSGMSLEFVPKALRTPELCALATYKGKGYTAMAIQFVPPALITAKMLNHFIESPRGRAYEGSLKPQWVPKRFRNFEMLKELLPSQPNILPIVPAPMVEKFWLLEGYPLRVVQSSGWKFNWFEHIPESARDAKLYEYVLQNLGANYYKSLPDSYKTKVLSLETFHAKGAEVLSAVPLAVFDSDFCSEILKSEVSLSDWRLNYKLKYLVEFVQDIPAMYFPQEAWNAAFCSQALAQTPFSVLAFPAQWVRAQDVEYVLMADVGLFYFFSDEVKQKFEALFNTLISDEVSPSHDRAATVCKTLQAIFILLTFHNTASTNDDLREMLSALSDFGTIGFQHNSQATLLDWRGKIEKCRQAHNLLEKLKKRTAPVSDSPSKQKKAPKGSLTGVSSGNLDQLSGLFDLLTRLAVSLEKFAGDD